MQCCPPLLTYAALQGVRCGVQGIVRLEASPEYLQVFLQAENAAADTPLRLLLLSSGTEGAAFDLGQADIGAEGVIRLTRTCPPVDLQLWDAVALATDWPCAKLIAAGWINGASGYIWQLEEAVVQFLRFPLP